MICLSMDTTGPFCSAALVSHSQIIGYSAKRIGRGHAEHLGPQIQSLLSAANIPAKKIDRLAVCTGPGSFTGLRVGIAMAKGLALPRSTPIIGISALQIWAAQHDPASTQTVMAIADVRRGEYFWQIFNAGQALAPPRLSALQDAHNALTPQMKVTGTGAKALSDSDGPPYSAAFVDPAILAWCALDAKPDDYPPVPLYHRPADAKLPGGITPPPASLSSTAP